VSLDREIAHLERAACTEPTPELLLRLAQLHLRADDPHSALRAYREVLGLAGVVDDLAGGVIVHPLRDQALLAIERLEASLADEEQRAAFTLRLQRLLGLLAEDQLAPDQHDELIRLEVSLGLEVHGQTPACPACGGAVAPSDTPEGSVRCARSGEGGDLCRHTDATHMFACPCCGLVVRAWNERKIRNLDPLEPPLLKPERARCPHCSSRVASWLRHFRRCPEARPVDFPVCGVCRKRGFHRSSLRCPRCATIVGETPCAAKRGAR
jgi:hypothetical protein